MGILDIREAKREGARLVIGLAGQSGDGKTRTALELGFGLAGRVGKKLGFLDTENKRGSLYADVLGERFMIGDLTAPFSPRRYIEAIEEFQATGVEVLVVDSVTHEWEGDGGCEDIAEGGGKMPNWKLAKREHKKFMSALLHCDMHIIACIRAREKTSFADPRKPVSLGVQPIQEKNFMFEMTASLLMHNQGTQQTVLKCPSELLSILGRQDSYITSLDGLALKSWVDGVERDPLETAKNKLRFGALKGMKGMTEAWAKLTRAEQNQLTGSEFNASVKAQAAAVDAGEPMDQTPIDTGSEGQE